MFFHSGFGLGLLLFRLRPGSTPFGVSGPAYSFYGFGFRSGITPFGASVWVYSFQGFGFRTPLKASAWVYSFVGFRAPFSPFRDWDLLL